MIENMHQNKRMSNIIGIMHMNTDTTSRQAVFHHRMPTQCVGGRTQTTLPCVCSHLFIAAAAAAKEEKRK